MDNEGKIVFVDASEEYELEKKIAEAIMLLERDQPFEDEERVVRHIQTSAVFRGREVSDAADELADVPAFVFSVTLSIGGRQRKVVVSYKIHPETKKAYFEKIT